MRFANNLMASVSTRTVMQPLRTASTAWRVPHFGQGCRSQHSRGVPSQQQQQQWQERIRVVTNGRRGSRALQEIQTVKGEKERFTPDVTKLEWMSPLTLDSIVKYPDPVLRAPNGRLATFDDDLKKLAAEMLEVGVNVQLMVFNPEGRKGYGEEFILCNPRIISTGSSTDLEEEGCLSFPGINGDVERSLMVKVKAQDENGKKFQIKLEGWQARIFQHEFDHLLGKLFVDTDRMEANDRKANHGNLQALEDSFLASNPGVEVQKVR